MCNPWSTCEGNFQCVLGFSADGETELCQILAVALQGDTLVPHPLDSTLRDAIKGKAEELRFQLEQIKSRRVNPKVLTDLHFADNKALLSELID